MRVWRDEEAKGRIMGNLMRRFSEADAQRHDDPRTVHVSELTFCLREAALHRLNPEPMTPRKVGFFLAGRAYHGLLEGLDDAEHHEAQVMGERDGIKIIGTIDSLGAIVTEIKSSRSDAGDIPQHYFRQTFYYMALKNQTEGRILIFRTKLQYRDDPLDVYRISLTPDELEKWRENLWRRAKLYSDALAKYSGGAAKPQKCQDLRELPMVEETMDWKCRICAYRG